MKKSTKIDLAIPLVLTLAMLLFLPVASKIGSQATVILFSVIIGIFLIYVMFFSKH